jgi:hypothetical protein
LVTQHNSAPLAIVIPVDPRGNYVPTAVFLFPGLGLLFLLLLSVVLKVTPARRLPSFG